MTEDTPTPPPDWPALWAALRELDGDEWDAESERLDALWTDAYQRAFVAYAITRPGWERENAEIWASETVDDALIALAGDPVAAAMLDVEQAEEETSYG
jgi:hypothetical protein